VRPLQDLCSAIEEGDVQKFTDSIAEYDNMTRLDAWKTTLLLRVKKRLESNEFDEGLDLT
jgi:alpha-soluble NSF attachment protein